MEATRSSRIWPGCPEHYEAEAHQLLLLTGLDLSKDIDVQHLKLIYEQALTYLDAYIHHFVQDKIRYLDDPVELLYLASQPGQSQEDACILLKVMHVIHHVTGRELLFLLPIPIQELFHRIETRVFQAIDGIHATAGHQTEIP